MRPGTMSRYYACKDNSLEFISDTDFVLNISCFDVNPVKLE